MATRLIRAAPSKPTLPAPLTPMTTSARRRVPTQTIDVSQLRAKLSAASGGSIALTPVMSNVAVANKYANRVHNRTSAIRAKCVDCSCGIVVDVTRCKIESCALHPFRMGEDPFRRARSNGTEAPVITPPTTHPVVVSAYERIRNRGTAMRAKCYECTNGQRVEIQNCTVTGCSLYPFRMGNDPHRAQRAAVPGAEAHDDDDGDVIEETPND